MLRDIGTVPKGLSNVFISLDFLELRSSGKKKNRKKEKKKREKLEADYSVLALEIG